MESKYTPRPWKTHNNYIVTDDQYPKIKIACVFSDDRDGSDIQAPHNANLIAAAPDLLETLQRTINWLRRIEQEYPGSINPDAIDKHLMPAINKAQPQS